LENKQLSNDTGQVSQFLYNNEILTILLRAGIGKKSRVSNVISLLFFEELLIRFSFAAQNVQHFLQQNKNKTSFNNKTFWTVCDRRW